MTHYADKEVIKKKRKYEPKSGHYHLKVGIKWTPHCTDIDFRIHPWFITYDFIYLSMAHKKIRLLHEYFVYVAIIFVRFNSQQKNAP
jgi:hypothetical protein